MVRGAQKQMIVVKTQDSAVFEEAYFVVRRNAVAGRMDMIAEANKIIEACGIGGKVKRKLDIKLFMIALGTFVGGGAIGAIIVAMLNLMAQ
ncbi:MAG: hypothetical protein E7649_07495 [Ruminococcaceae bacterium]|nr:hypothetical protein [Oscillospiraceae bacterium]